MMMLRNVAIGVVSALAMVASTGAEAPQYNVGYDEQWPQWRGPDGNGIAPYATPPLSWSETSNVCWKVEVPGRGHASPIVWGPTVFVLTAVEVEPDEPVVEDPPANEPGGERRRPRGVQPQHPVQYTVLAFDRSTGQVRWARVARTAVPHEATHRTATWASASAVTNGRVLIASFGSAGIYAYDLDGELLWERDLGDQATRNAFGEGSSPVISLSTLLEPTLVVNWDHEGDSFIEAMNVHTGETLWRRERDEPTSWSTPLILGHKVIVSATNRVRAYDLKTGAEIWHLGGMTLNVIPTPTYSVSTGLLYLMSGFRGDALIAMRPKGAEGDLDGTDHVVWSVDRDASYTPSGVAYGDGFYYLKRNNGILSSVDARTGEPRFGPVRLEGIDGEAGVYASLAGAAGRIYVVGQNGTTLVLGTGPELEILATNRLDDGFDASPAFAGRQLFLRGREHLYCLEESSPPKE